jgi:hypothetical protein
LIGLIEECRTKPSFDYQRIIICHTNSPNLGQRLSRRLGVPLGAPGRPLRSKRAAAVVVIDKPGDCAAELLESVVLFVNRRRGVVVLLSNGQDFDAWPAQWLGPAAQIRRRTHITIEFPPYDGP